MKPPSPPIPVWQLYGEDSPFPDILHVERIVDRAQGLDWRIAAHRHAHLHQVFLIGSGDVRLRLEGRDLPCVPPVVINIPRGAAHSFDFSAGTEGYVLTLPIPDFPDLFASPDGALSRLETAFAVAPPAGIGTLFASLALDHASGGELRRLRLRAGALAVCAHLAEHAPVGTPAPHNDPRLTRFEALVRGNLDQHWQIRDYARALSLSDRHLRRLCLQATGRSALALVEAIRMNEASRLLAYTRMQIQEVGFALGYDDPAYFTRAFRRETGQSPSDYRAMVNRT